jgi:hypothetical protein
MWGATDEIDKFHGPNVIISEYTREESDEVHHETRLKQGKATTDSREQHTDSSDQYGRG